MARLTVVVASGRPAAPFRRCIELLADQAREVDAELVVASSSAAPRAALPPEARWVEYPGASVFELRARAIAEAKGDIVAVTEDHCHPAPGLFAGHLAAHEKRPEVGAVGGVVLPGPMQEPFDWANYLLSFVHLTPPLEQAERYRVPAVANVSFKRRVLPPGIPRPGFIEVCLLSVLASRGLVAWEEGLSVTHIQSRSTFGNLSAHFHNGRCTAGNEAITHTFAQRRYFALRFPRTVVRVMRHTLEGLRARPALVPHWRSEVPRIAALSLCHGVGELAGILTGPGQSLQELE